MTTFTLDDAANLARECARQLLGELRREFILFGIPRGGVSAALLVAQELRSLDPEAHVQVRSTREPPNSGDVGAYIVVDDIYVTGETAARAAQALKTPWLAALVQKGTLPTCVDYTCFGCHVPDGDWVTFPWETADPDLGKPEDAVRRLIEYLGHDPSEPDLLETPARALRFYDELREAAKAEFKATSFTSEVDDLIVVKDIPLFSLCAHHMLPYAGRACVGYIPTSGKILGLSKLVRVVQKCAAGLTMQEELSRRIAAEISQAIGSPNVAVVTRATHSCMTMRGVKAIDSVAIASAMLGDFRQQPALRAEFFSLTQKEA